MHAIIMASDECTEDGPPGEAFLRAASAHSVAGGVPESVWQALDAALAGDEHYLSKLSIDDWPAIDPTVTCAGGAVNAAEGFAPSELCRHEPGHTRSTRTFGKKARSRSRSSKSDV